MVLSVFYLLTDPINGIKISNRSHHEEGDSPFSDAYIDVLKHPGELCNRTCVSGVNRVCYYKFTLEHYHALGM